MIWRGWLFLSYIAFLWVCRQKAHQEVWFVIAPDMLGVQVDSRHIGNSFDEFGWTCRQFPCVCLANESRLVVAGRETPHGDDFDANGNRFLSCQRVRSRRSKRRFFTVCAVETFAGIRALVQAHLEARLKLCSWPVLVFFRGPTSEPRPVLKKSEVFFAQTKGPMSSAVFATTNFECQQFGQRSLRCFY